MRELSSGSAAFHLAREGPDTPHRPHLPELRAPSARLAQPDSGQPQFTSRRSGIKKPIS